MPAATQLPVVLVLASGRGERFRASGGTGSKLQAPLHGRTVLDWTLAAVRASGLLWHLEDRGHPGMGDSIAAAVRATADASGWLVLPGDLPLIAPDTLRAVAAALEGGTVVVPVSGDGHPAHPVGFPAEAGDALMALEGAAGARSVLQTLQHAGRLLRLTLDDPGVATDIDTVADLERAAHRLRERPPA